MLQVFCMFFIVLYCDEGRQIVISVLSFMWCVFFNMVAYKKEISIGSLAVCFMMSLCFLMGATFLGVVFSYITNVNDKLQQSNEQNVKLLNGMHEGVLILSNEQDKQFKTMFCNKPAFKLINTFLNDKG